jgi:biotin carboxyl carrier protein
MAYTFYRTYEVDIIDAEARYLLNRGESTTGSGEKSIRSPMPGKVIRIPVRNGDLVKKGEIVIILSAMKMESEYKAPAEGRVTRVAVREGDLTEIGQLLIEIE